MWVFFNRDYQGNKRSDLVDIQDEVFVKEVLVAEKIAQVIENPHEAYANIIKKREIDSKVNATNKK